MESNDADTSKESKGDEMEEKDDDSFVKVRKNDTPLYQLDNL